MVIFIVPKCASKTPVMHRPFDNALFLLLGFFVLRVRLAPFAVLLELDFARDKLPVLAGPVVGAVALAACESEKLIL